MTFDKRKRRKEDVEPGAFHAGTRGDADNRIPLELWHQTQADLTDLDEMIRGLAAEHGCTALGNRDGRVSWPSRGIRRRMGWWRRDAQIGLQPRYFVDGQLYYVLGSTDIPPFATFFGRAHHYAQLKEYLPHELGQLDRIEADLLDAIGIGAGP